MLDLDIDAVETVSLRHKDIVEENSVLNKRYTLGKMIAEGGLSLVYEARDIYADYFEDDRALVIKLPSSEIADKKDVAAFIYAEYSVLNLLNHQHIVKVVDFGIDEHTEVPYLVMQRLEGNLLVNTPMHKINTEMKRRLAFSLYKALVYIHTKGIVHADINPTNIMISPHGDAQIFDFGISQNTGAKKRFHMAYSKNNAYNPIYSAPEIFEGSAPTRKTDLFSLACVLYELYTNELPFKTSSRELKDKALSREHMQKIPLMQRAWFKKVLSYESSKRPETIPLCIRLRYLLKASAE
jgi:serine/threonine-protein kinase Stk1